MAAPTTIYVKAKVGEPTKLGDCPFCHRVLLTYEAKKLPYKAELIDFDNKPEWLIQTSGGKVPVIKEEGKDYMPDSDIITAHVEKEHPQPSLASSVPPEIGAKLFPAFRGFLMGPPEEQAAKKELLGAELKAINDYLAAHGWELPSELTAVKKYMDTLAGLPEWQATDYGQDAIIAGWKRHIAMGH